MNVFARGLLMVLLFCGGSAVVAQEANPPAGAVPSPLQIAGPFGAADVKAFDQPPKVYHPETWFHFIGGNVAREGVNADISAIAESGISGIQFFHGQFGGAWPGVQPQIKALSENWDSEVQNLAGQCRESGLRFTMQNCPGWAMAGGPWIEPRNAMRHLVWSRKDISGGQTVEVRLPEPAGAAIDWRDYREVAVMAFPTPEGDTGRELRPVAVKSNRDDLAWDQWLTGEAGSELKLAATGEPVWLEMTFEREVTLRTVQLPPVESFSHQWCYEPGVFIRVEAVLPGGSPEMVASVDVPPSNWQDDRPFSLACREVPSKRYRVTITNEHEMTLQRIRFFSAARKNNWEAEAAWVLRDLSGMEDPAQSREAWVDPDEVILLNEQTDTAGVLRWKAPPGNWTVMRWGHVNTGMKNGPAPPEATGFECNKLSASGADAHFAGYIGRLSTEEGPLSGGLLNGMLLDSWECKTQTWTTGMDREFHDQRGYSLWSYFPALAGYVMGDPLTTSRFLRDWRATINDLLVENFYGRMARLAGERGLDVSYETAVGDVFPGDIMEYYKYADVPMCEFWHPRSPSYVGSIEFKPVEPCVSAARLYGKPRVAAESFTSFNLTWNEHPRMLKPIVDIHFAKGVTHPVFHTYTHYPRTDFRPPGTSFGSGIGTPFLREQTWWEHMPAFTGYLARCNYLLERGKPVSDVLLYLGDELDHKPSQHIPFPEGYQYDYCNPDVLLNRLTVEEGQLMTPEGIRYRLLWLRDCRRMVPETLEKMTALVKDGAVLLGEPPRELGTLSGGAEAEKRFRAAVKALWGTAGETVRRVGKGTVMSGLPVKEALARMDVAPDCLVDEVVTGDPGGVLWLHRKAADADWYFVAAPHQEKGFKGTMKFRARGKAELWDPVTGKTQPVKNFRQRNGASFVEFDLPPSGSVFVVFRRDKGYRNKAVRRQETQTAMRIDGPWKLSFPSGWGAPENIRLNDLKSWTGLDLSAEAQAFSGTAVYNTTFQMEAHPAGEAVLLDLGRVEVIARVRVNGEPAGTLWTRPYCLDITDRVKPGENLLEVEVTNTWFNRLVYDAGQEEEKKKTWTISGPGKEEDFVPAGLLGPVKLKMAPGKN